MSSATQITITPDIDYRAYRLARVLVDALGCGELVGYRIAQGRQTSSGQLQRQIKANPQ